MSRRDQRGKAAPRHGLSRDGYRQWHAAFVIDGHSQSVFKTLSRLEPSGEDRYLLEIFRGNVLLVVRQNRRARKHYLRARRLDPTGVLALTSMGFYHHVRRRPKSPATAVGYYARAVSLLEPGLYDTDLDGELQDAYEGLVECLLELKKVKAAQQVAARARARYPRCPWMKFEDVLKATTESRPRK